MLAQPTLRPLVSVSRALRVLVQLKALEGWLGPTPFEWQQCDGWRGMQELMKRPVTRQEIAAGLTGHPVLGPVRLAALVRSHANRHRPRAHTHTSHTSHTNT